MMRWLRWLTYAHDPEAHAALARIEARLDAIAPVAPAVMRSQVIRPIRLDCGHVDTSYATTADGITRCRSCEERYQERTVRRRAPRA